MPTLTLTHATTATLGLSRAELRHWALTPDAKHRLEGLLLSRGFDVTRTIDVSELASQEGFLLTQ